MFSYILHRHEDVESSTAMARRHLRMPGRSIRMIPKNELFPGFHDLTAGKMRWKIILTIPFAWRTLRFSVVDVCIGRRRRSPCRLSPCRLASK